MNMYYMVIDEERYCKLIAKCSKSKWKSVFIFCYVDEKEMLLEKDICIFIQARKKISLFCYKRGNELICKKELDEVPYAINVEECEIKLQDVKKCELKGMVVQERGIIMKKKNTRIELSKNLNGKEVFYTLASKDRECLERFALQSKLNGIVNNNYLKFIVDQVIKGNNIGNKE